MLLEKFKLKFLALILLALLFFVPSVKIEASRLVGIYNNLGRIAANVNSMHSVYFVLTDPINAGEAFTVTFPSAFSFGSLYDHTDMSLDEGSTNICGIATFTNKPLGASPSGSTWGVNKSGNTVFTITSGTGTLATGRCIRVNFYTNGANHTVTNPNVTTNTVYNMTVDTATESGQLSVIILGDSSSANVDQVSLEANVSTSILMGIDTVTSDCNNNTQTTPANQTVNFGQLYPGVPVISGNSIPFVCIEAGTNSVNGFRILVQSSRGDSIGGLVSGSGDILSATANLNLLGTTTGYGLRVSSLGTATLGSFTATSPFNSSTPGDIGQVSGSSGTASQIVSSTAPVRSGNTARIAIELGAKSSTATPADTYSDVLTFTAFTNL